MKNGDRTALLREFEHLSMTERKKLWDTLGWPVSDIGRPPRRHDTSTPEGRNAILRELGLTPPEVDEGDEE